MAGLSGARFVQISRAAWDREFSRLSPEAKLVWFAVVTHFPTIMPGLVRVGPRALAEQKGLTPAYITKGLRGLSVAGYAVVDEAEQLIAIPGALEMDCEASHKIVKGWVSNLATLPRDSPPVMAMATALAAKTRKPALLDELGLIQHRIAIDTPVPVPGPVPDPEPDPVPAPDPQPGQSRRPIALVTSKPEAASEEAYAAWEVAKGYLINSTKGAMGIHDEATREHALEAEAELRAGGSAQEACIVFCRSYDRTARGKLQLKVVRSERRRRRAHRRQPGQLELLPELLEG